MLSKAPPLRTAAASFRLQPANINTRHTSSIANRQGPGSKYSEKPKAISTSPISKSIIQTRAASSTTSPESSTSTTTRSRTPENLLSTTPSPAEKSPSSSSSTNPSLITWNTFFTLRKRRRWWQMGSSVVSSLGSTVGGVATVVMIDPNAFASAVPQIDPMFTMGAAVTGFGIAGWMAGPFLGTALWRMRNRGVVGDMEVKEKEFFSRIKKHRVDPAGSSMQNPVPDYYGEKIGSVQGYRRWLKDQRAFNRKRLASIV